MKHISKTISLPADAWEELDKVADKTEISRSAILQIILFNFFEARVISGRVQFNKQKIKTLFLQTLKTPNKQ